MPTNKNKFTLILILVIAVLLRFWQINTLPSLNPDEAALGYNAYSLLKTGKDEHGISWPLHFKSFSDYKVNTICGPSSWVSKLGCSGLTRSGWGTR